MTKTVKVALVTKSQIFPAGTVQEDFLYELKDSNNTTLTNVKTSALEASFADVAEGNYTVVVTSNGVSATASVTIASTGVSINVPDTVTITLV